MRVYLDTSAASKLVVEEDESAALAAYLEQAEDLCSLVLLETELRRVVVRLDLDQSMATDVLAGVSLFEMPRSLYREAGLLPGRGLRSLDALHVAGAIRLEVDSIATYDVRMAAAAAALGIDVVQPR